MRTTVLFPVALLLALTGAQTTVTGYPMSEIGDGQPQAPTGAPASGGSKTGSPAGSPANPGGPEIPNTPLSESSPYSNPFTIYTTQTNSLGVITGQPLPVTTQPSVITSQPSVITSIPTGTTSYSILTAPGPVVLNSTLPAGGATGSSNGTAAAASTSTAVASSSTLTTTTTSSSSSPTGSSSSAGSSAAPSSGSGNGAGMVQAGLSAVMAAIGFVAAFTL